MWTRLVAGTLLAAVVSCTGSAGAPSDFVVTVGSETFVLRVHDPETVRLALDNLNGRNHQFPIGPLRTGDGGFNAPWSWHIDPERVRFTEVAIEVCDGAPSYVETHVGAFAAIGYCPWSARVIGVAP